MTEHAPLAGGPADGGSPGDPASTGGVVEPGRLAAALVSFVATVAEDFTTDEVLGRLVQAAVQLLDVDGVGVMVPDQDTLLRFAFASGPLSSLVSEAESVQEELQEGPCQDTHQQGRVVDVHDLATESSWPGYRRRVLGLGIHGVTTLPMHARGRSWGVLDLYRAQARRCSPSELVAAQALADLATSVLVIGADRWAAGVTRDELVRRAMHDQLTDLPVRRVLLEQLTQALAGLARHPGHIGVLFCDLDGLKYVNDTFGHAAGDQLLMTFARRVRATLRPSDVLARVGGDEFVVLLHGLTHLSEATDVAHRLMAALSAPQRLHGHGRDQDLAPSASIGVAVTTDPATDAETLIAHADSAMYRAKRTGRGRVDVFHAQEYEAGRARATTTDDLHAALRTALDHHELDLHYQPVAHLTDDHPTTAADGTGLAALLHAGAARVESVEALLRWHHLTRGLLAAGDFLTRAECTGLMGELGDWVLRTACEQLRTWDDQLGRTAPRQVLVNISGLELSDPGLPRRVARSLGAAALAPRRLVLEITETALITDDGGAAAVIAALHRTGCALAIDDLGTGYASLRRVVDIPATTLKVDRSFTHDLLDNPAAAAVVATALRLGQDLHRTVVVEGVEDATLLRALHDLGARHLQGYHLARPVPPDGITALLDHRP